MADFCGFPGNWLIKRKRPASLIKTSSFPEKMKPSQKMRCDEGPGTVMGSDKDSNTDTDAVTAVARKEKELTGQDLERARDGNDLSEKFGRQNISSTTSSTIAVEAKKKEDEKFESAMRLLLQQTREELERRLEQLNEHIAETNAKIEELREELQTTETLLEKQFGKDWREKLKRGDLDLDDPLLRQWLMQEHQLKDYLERREKLIKERDELENQVAEIERSRLPDHLKIEKMKEVLEQGSPSGVQEVWRDNLLSEQVQEITGLINTDAGERLESVNNIFPGFESLSVSGSGEFGKGIDAKIENIKSKFANASELSLTEDIEPVASNIPASKSPKPSG